MALTIAESFDLKLPTAPSITFAFQDSYRPIRSNVTSTIQEEAPRAFIKEDISVFQHIAQRYLHLRNRSLQGDMPMLEKTHFLHTEADVLRLSTLHLMHPVNVALQELCPQGFKLVCGSEITANPKSRVDMLWSLRSDDGGVSHSLAVLEVKNTHVIHCDEFAPAEATAANVEDKISTSFERGVATLLEGNAFWISKQAAKYARECPDVAVFDWTAMFIFNYTFARSNRNEAVRGFFFTESGNNRNMTFRRLLFAFVARPLMRYKVQNGLT